MNLRTRGFSLVEVLISMTILTILVVLIFSVLSNLSMLWQRSVADIDAFQSARASFERVTRNLGQATLNPYWDYQRDASGNPLSYMRNSNLHFVSGFAADTTLTGSLTHSVVFQAPVGLTQSPTLQGASSLLNVLGYYVTFQSDSAYKPSWIAALPGVTSKSRFRLMEIEQPTESFQVYTSTTVLPSWVTTTAATPIADNCIALVLSPRLTSQDDVQGAQLAPNYTYNSRQNATANPQPQTANQLPPCMLVTMIAISEKSAIQLTQAEANPAALQTTITGILSGKFQVVSSYDKDLGAVTAALAQKHIDYHVFSAWVPILESKWSQ